MSRADGRTANEQVAALMNDLREHLGRVWLVALLCFADSLPESPADNGSGGGDVGAGGEAGSSDDADRDADPVTEYVAASKRTVIFCDYLFSTPFAWRPKLHPRQLC